MTDASAPPALTGRRVVLGVTGGIAAYKAALLARLLVASGAEVTVVMTPSASRFVGPDTFAALTRRPVHSDLFERPDLVQHVRLGHDADVAVVAPATANVLAKLALGLADDLLTSTLLEASFPLVLAPAMHTGMWIHPATRQHVATLKDRGAILVGPAEGPLAAGDEGVGRMADPGDILAAVVAAVAPSGPLSGRRILVTAGPTHEAVDRVRYLGNRSSGKMGFALATEIAARGGDVTLVTGPVSLPDPHRVAVLRVETAREMADVVLERFQSFDAVVMAAAVADFRPSTVVDGKIKKASGHDRIELEPTTDILATLGKRKERQVLVGFAAETEGLEREGRRKLAEKNLDLVVVNQVGSAGTGFGSDTNRAAILARTGFDAPLRSWTKPELASAVADRLAALLSEEPR